MNPYILTGEINLFNGIFVESIPFEMGLNILSGENGTGKTKVLQQIKEGKYTSSGDIKPSIVAFSPKRNSLRRNINEILNDIRQHDRKLPDYMKERINAKLIDDTFQNYSSFAEVFFLVYQEKGKDGNTKPADIMNNVTEEFNSVLVKVFSNYSLESTWDKDSGSPDIKLRKEELVIPLNSLSTGEQEVLSLLINLYTSKDDNDVFLIDEPEAHLNWHLEERLFNYFDWFCNTYDKQIITATHSRVVFKDDYLKKTQFLIWDNGHITLKKQIPDEQRRRIAGEGIDIIRLCDYPKTTFFVEDNSHKQIIECIAGVLSNDVTVKKLGGSSYVEMLYRLSTMEDGWDNCFFLIDGDNRENPFPNQPRFIHLEKYCIENYLLDLQTAAKITNKSEKEVLGSILTAVKANEGKMLKRNKWAKSLLDSLKIEQIDEAFLSHFDFGEIFDSYLCEFNIDFSSYIEKYIRLLQQESKLKSVFPEKLINAIEQT